MAAFLSFLWMAVSFALLGVGLAPLVYVLNAASHLSYWQLLGALPLALIAGAALLLATVHFAYRFIPACSSGSFRVMKDGSAILWAIENSISTPCMRLFQGIGFLNETLRYLVLKALHAHVQYDSWITSRAIIGNPRKVHVGHKTIVGEFAHLAPSYQPRIGRLIVGDIRIGDEVLVSGYCVILANVTIGAKSVLQVNVFVSPDVRIGTNVRVGARTTIGMGARIGNNVRIGKDCHIEAQAAIPDGTIVVDGSYVPASGSLPEKFTRPAVEAPLRLAVPVPHPAN